MPDTVPSPIKIRFRSRSLPPVETRFGRFVIEPAVYGRGGDLRHCVVAHSERVGRDGRFEVLELSEDFGSYHGMLCGFAHGFDVQPPCGTDEERAASILRHLLDQRLAEVVS